MHNFVFHQFLFYHKKGNIKVYKIDKDNKKVVLGNVEFKLYSEEFKKIIGTYYTDVNGELEIKNLRTGNYKLIETKTNKWYNLANSSEYSLNSTFPNTTFLLSLSILYTLIFPFLCSFVIVCILV